MAIELGALSLAIRDTGSGQLLDTLGKIDAAASRIGKTPVTPKVDTAPVAKLTVAQKALAREVADGTRMFALQARTVDVTSQRAVQELRESAAAQRDWLVAVGASTDQQTKFAAATQVLERRLDASNRQQARAAQLAQRTANTHSILGRQITSSSGAMIGAGRASITAINAVAFAASQMAATGEASFRSLATALSSFAAFFGPQGAIASLVITTGLAMTDFFSRRQKDIRETAQTTIDETQRAVREVQFAVEQGDVAGLTARARALQEGTATNLGVNQLKQQAADLQKDIDKKTAAFEKLDRQTQISERYRAAVEVNALKAQRVVVVRDLARLEDEIASLSAKVISAPLAREDPKAITVTASKDAKEKDVLDTITKQVSALKTMVDLRKIDANTLKLAHDLQEQITTELANGNNSLEQKSKLLAAQNDLLRTGLLLEQMKVRKPTPSAETGPAKKIAISAAERGALNSGLNRELTDAEKELLAFQDTLAAGLGSAIVNGLAGGFAMGLADGGIGEGFRQMGAQLLAGLADVFLQVGAKAIMASTLLQSLAAGISTLNPAVAIAAGVALLALAKAMGGKGGSAGAASSFGRGGSFTGRETIADAQIRRASLPPGARPGSGTASTMATGPTLQVIGVESPEGQRLIGRSMSKFQQRGGA